jgi:hypothetical protein
MERLRYGMGSICRVRMVCGAMAASSLAVIAGCDRICPKTPSVATPVPGIAVAPRPPIDPRVTYELRERCGRESREWFKHFYGDGSSKSQDYEGFSSYTNHYNTQQERCLALITTSGFSRSAKTNKINMSDARDLVDVSENKTIGEYFRFRDNAQPMQCSLAGTDCNSQNGWERLVAPYMDR